jgi:DNA-binding transcriptional ArsR family regulator
MLFMEQPTTAAEAASHTAHTVDAEAEPAAVQVAEAEPAAAQTVNAEAEPAAVQVADPELAAVQVADPELAAVQVADPELAAVQVAEAGPAAVRTVDSVAALKAMADPTRLAILAALMRTRDLPVMSVKELAAELGEPQTKLYRHVRQLEAAGLIRVASTRMVSGILEQRYQACQRDLRLGRGVIAENADESEELMRAALDRYRDGFFAAFRAGRLPAGDVPPGESYRKPLVFMSDLKVSPARAAQLMTKLEEVIDSFQDEQAEDPDGVSLNLFISSYVPGDPDPG